MQKVVIDTNIIIDHFRIRSAVFDVLLEGSLKQNIKVYLSGIVYTEVNSGTDTHSVKKLKEIEDLLLNFEFIAADQEISQKAGFLVRDYPNLGTADAIVAATAINFNAKLATRNTKDFENIKNLKFFKLRA